MLVGVKTPGLAFPIFLGVGQDELAETMQNLKKESEKYQWLTTLESPG